MPDTFDRLKAALTDRYAIERELGSGGMATVYLADDLKHHRKVAVKVLRLELAAALGTERFLREIEIAAGLTHPHILPLHDSGEADGFLYYVMPYVEGESLRDRLNREKQLPLEDAVQIAREVADALGSAHSHGVVHRDIKPENVLLAEGHAVVADFGIARAITAAGGDQLTETGLAIGTPAYMSPEQVAGGKELDGRSDVYSLGCILYEMLAGQPPFTGPTVESVVHQHLTVEPPSITNLRPTVPAEIAGTVARALAKTPADRFSPAAQFAEALRVDVARTGREARRPLRRWQWVGITAAIGVVGVLLFMGPLSSFLRTGGATGTGEERQRDWIIVADFEGSAPAAYRGTARDLVSTALEQSTIVATVSAAAIRRGLRLAGRRDTARLVEDLARELAIRASIGAVVSGQIDRVGDTYSVLLRVLDAESATAIVAVSEVARSDDDLIPTLSKAVRGLRVELGERRSAIQRNRPLEEVSTPSFAAYLMYRDVTERFVQTANNREAIAGYRNVLELDPDFASAWSRMVAAYGNLGLEDSARAALAEVQRRWDRLTEWEQLRNQAFAAGLSGDWPGGVRAQAELVRKYRTGHNNLALYLDLLGRFEEAAELTRQWEVTAPFGLSQIALDNQVRRLLALGQFDEAWHNVEQLQGDLRRGFLVSFDLARGNWAPAERLARELENDVTAPPRWRANGAAARASALAARGEVRAAHAALDHAVALARELGVGRVRLYAGGQLVLAVASGGMAPALDTLTSTDTSTAGLIHRALAAAVAGDTASAKRYLEIVHARPAEDLGRYGSAPAVVSAWIAAVAGRWDTVPSLVSPAASWVWPHRSANHEFGNLVRWLLGEAYERLGRLDSAAAYFELLASPTETFRWEYVEQQNGLPYSFAHQRLVLLYARMGRIEDAQRHWQVFAETFTDPDPALVPLIEEARKAAFGERGG